jgi:7-cyano-7-deazaguanine reductase
MNPEAKVLGQNVTYPQYYSPDVLEAIPRQWNRTYLNIEDEHLPFVGADIWHAYELSFLTKTGMPVVGVLKLSVPIESTCIVESKSLKLYLNSFNMSSYGDTRSEGISEVEQVIKDDLSRLLNCDVELCFISQMTSKQAFIQDFEVLEQVVDIDALDFDVYNESESLLESGSETELSVKSELLRSNCKVTNQPDWGDVFISMKGETVPTKSSLLKYIVSFRNEQHFHEEICEAIYERLNRIFAPKELMVACLYTRRGGIDICPVRASSPELLNFPLLEVDVMTDKLLRS